MAKTVKVKWTEGKIVGMLMKKYQDTKWRCFSQLRDAGGFSSESTMDLYVVNVWPSQHIKIAFEIKCSRADFLSELNQPSKRANGLRLSNEFYFVTAPGIVKSIEEIPENCGWYECNSTGNSMRQMKAAQHRKCESLDVLF